MSGGVLVTGRLVSAFRSTLRDGGAAVCVIVRPHAERPGKVHALMPIAAGCRMQAIVAADDLVAQIHKHKIVRMTGSSLESWFDHGVDVRLLDAIVCAQDGTPLAWAELAEVAA